MVSCRVVNEVFAVSPQNSARKTTVKPYTFTTTQSAKSPLRAKQSAINAPEARVLCALWALGS
jgi:hypothetical protein